MLSVPMDHGTGWPPQRQHGRLAVVVRLGDAVRQAAGDNRRLYDRLSGRGASVRSWLQDNTEIAERIASPRQTSMVKLGGGVALFLGMISFLCGVAAICGVVRVSQPWTASEAAASVQLTDAHNVVEASSNAQLHPASALLAARTAQRTFQVAVEAFPAPRKTMGGVGGSSSCRAWEEDVLYRATLTLYQMEFVMSARDCRARCKNNTACSVWNWGQGNVCYLQHLRRGEQLVKRHRPGLVSGQMCRFEAPDLNDAKSKELIMATVPRVQHDTATAAAVATTTTTPVSTTKTETWSSTSETVTSRSSSNTAETTSTTSTSSREQLAPEQRHPNLQRGFLLPAMAFPRKAEGTLFCFTLFVVGSYEEELLFAQYNQGASIFACDEFELYTNKTVELAPGVLSRRVNSSLRCELGGEFHTALNNDIFMMVWSTVYRDGRYLNHDWTIKVDADSVFLPDRLRPLVLLYELDARVGAGVYLNNCQFGLHGPIEVLSQAAVKSWGSGMQTCEAHFQEICSGSCFWGEDMFLDQCLWKVLMSKRVDEYRLLLEDHCAPPPGWNACTDPTVAAFHPFKSKAEYLQCLSMALVNTKADIQMQVKQ